MLFAALYLALTSIVVEPVFTNFNSIAGDTQVMVNFKAWSTNTDSKVKDALPVTGGTVTGDIKRAYPVRVLDSKLPLSLVTGYTDRDVSSHSITIPDATEIAVWKTNVSWSVGDLVPEYKLVDANGLILTYISTNYKAIVVGDEYKAIAKKVKLGPSKNALDNGTDIATKDIVVSYATAAIPINGSNMRDRIAFLDYYGNPMDRNIGVVTSSSVASSGLPANDAVIPTAQAVRKFVESSSVTNDGAFVASTNAVVKFVISRSNPVFSAEVLAVGLNIDKNIAYVINQMAGDTNLVAALGDLSSDSPIDPVTGATTIGSLLAALAASVVWLKKKYNNTVDAYMDSKGDTSYFYMGPGGPCNYDEGNHALTRIIPTPEGYIAGYTVTLPTKGDRFEFTVETDKRAQVVWYPASEYSGDPMQFEFKRENISDPYSYAGTKGVMDFYYLPADIVSHKDTAARTKGIYDSITGILKSDGSGAIVKAVSGTDYEAGGAVSSHNADTNAHSNKADAADVHYGYENKSWGKSTWATDGYINRMPDVTGNVEITAPGPTSGKVGEFILRFAVTTSSGPTVTIHPPTGKSWATPLYAVSGDTLDTPGQYEMLIQLIPTSTANTYEYVACTRRISE